MKIIHCADVHLGSKMEAKLPKDKADERKGEVRATFNRLIDYARREGVRAILLAGDLFDSDRPLKKDKQFFYSAVKSNPQIDFLYLRGNHDSEESYTEFGLENLKVFGEQWTSYIYEDVAICGIEISKTNCSSMYSTLRLDPDFKNVVMLHGQVGDSSGVCKINLPKLRNKNIDYLALGHIHTHGGGKLDDRGAYAYCGCLEGRGFDETGEKGFVLIDTDGAINTRFIPFSQRTIVQTDADISGATDTYPAYLKVQEQLKIRPEDMLRLNLTGEISFTNETLAKDIEQYLNGICYFVSVKDETQRKIEISDYEGDLSLRGEFIRTVLSDDKISEADKHKIITIGLKALSGQGVE